MIESDGELLKRYGLASALYSSVDYLLGEYVRFEGGLHQANQDLVNHLMNDKTFGVKIELAKKLIADDKLKADLAQGLKDRNLLAHGVSVDQGGQKFLMSKTSFHPLTVTELDTMVERARKLAGQIIQEIQKKHKLKS